MTKPTTYGLVTLFSGVGAKSVGMLRARGPDGERFVSVGAFDVDPDCCEDFRQLTGAPAQVVDLGKITPAQLAERCERRPDVVVMSPPCKSWSSCMSESKASEPEYQALAALARRAIDLVLEAWAVPPALIMMENVPRMLSRGREMLRQIRALLHAKGYATDLRTHDCGEFGGLAQSRRRVLLVARHRELCPEPVHNPPKFSPLPMSSVLWKLPVPLPGVAAAGPLHMLPKLSNRNALRLSAIRAGSDWRDLPGAIALRPSTSRHAGLYGPQDPSRPAHAVIAEARTGKGWADVADPRVNAGPNTQSGLYGVGSGARPAHAVLGSARAGSSSWGCTADPRVAPRATRQNGGFGVNEPSRASHAIVAEGSLGNTWGSVADPRVPAQNRGNFGVLDPGVPSKCIQGSHDARTSPGSVVDPRVKCQHSDSFGVLEPRRPSKVIRGLHRARTAPASVADDRTGFEPSHRLIAHQSLDASREDWVRGGFELVGPEVDLRPRGRPGHLIILAPDGTVHRPLTPLELAVLQGLPAWHRPGDPEQVPIGSDGGRWLELTGTRKGSWRDRNGNRRTGWVERIGNAMPPQTAQAYGNEALAALSASRSSSVRLPFRGVWVERERAEAS